MINTCIISLKDTLDIFRFVIFSVFFWGGGQGGHRCVRFWPAGIYFVFEIKIYHFHIDLKYFL